MTAAVGIAQSGVNNVSWRNRIINGGMVVDQRNAGASVSNDGYAVDRFNTFRDGTAVTVTSQRSTVAPTGFTNSLLFTTTSAGTQTTGNGVGIQQRVEGFNFADMMWGTANAQTVTLSFWVRSSLTGTFSGSLVNSAFNRSYPYSYTISAANTWEYKTITIAGDTTGTWVTDNGIGVRVYWDMGSNSSLRGTAGAWTGSGLIGVTGAVSVVGTNGATFYITGVQLERGTTATPFEYRDYGRELIMCQRYFENVLWFANGYSAQWTGAAFYGVQYPFLVQKRASPSISNFTSSGYWVAPGQNVFSANGSHSFTISGVNQNAFAAQSNRPAGGSTPSQGNMYFWEASVTIPVSAEL